MTEWKSIKIPEETRTKAKNDPRTYWELIEAGLRNDGGDTQSDTHTPSVDSEVLEELGRLRREFDEFKHDVPRKVAEELR